jgi:hypothetical protein
VVAAAKKKTRPTPTARGVKILAALRAQRLSILAASRISGLAEGTVRRWIFQPDVDASRLDLHTVEGFAKVLVSKEMLTD